MGILPCRASAGIPTRRSLPKFNLREATTKFGATGVVLVTFWRLNSLRSVLFSIENTVQ